MIDYKDKGKHTMSFDQFITLQRTYILQERFNGNKLAYCIYAKEQGSTLEFTLKVLFPAKYD